MGELKLDRFRVNFINRFSSSVQVWTQFEECYKCSFDQRIGIDVSTNTSKHVFKDYPSYYTLKYKFTKKGEPETPLCNGIISAQDQSIYNLTIDESNQCSHELIEEGRNDWVPLIVAIGILFVIAGVFYLGRFLYNKRKGDAEDNDGLNSKISTRLSSLDAFRGLTMLLMIFVNWGAGEYHSLDHAEWDGLRFADFIFPSFIFIMGVTMAISLKNLVIKKDLPLLKVYLGVVTRSLKLFFVGLILGSNGHADIRTIRIPGVLQRFAVSYLFVASVHILSLHINKDELYSRINYMNDIIPYWPDWILTGVMLILHFTLTFAWKFDPDCPRGYVGPGGLAENAAYSQCVGGAANRIDKWLFTENHIYRHFTASELYDPEHNRKKVFNLMHDPEGLLGCTNSIVLTIIGLQVGKIILTYSSTKQRLIRWAVWSLTLGVLTAIFAPTNWIPINKNLWSFTFVTATGSVAIAIFTGFYLLIDHFKVWPNGQPFHYPGMNSILLYIGHDFTGGMLPFTFIGDTQSHIWPLTQNIIGVTLWLLISIYLAKKNFFFTL